ncbi:MAG: MFS transporter [archaeon]
MNTQKIKQKNIRMALIGASFISASTVMISFFLPYFLKEKGLGILEIGFLFTIGLAVGSLLFGVIFSKILDKIRLRTGLISTSLLSSISTLIVYISPSLGGALLSKIGNRVESVIAYISNDVTMQHNVTEKTRKKVSALHLISDTFGLTIGLILGVLLIKTYNFSVAFLVFAILAIPALFFFSKVDDKTRFRRKEKNKLKKIPLKLKLILISELAYWLGLASSFALVVTFLVTDKFQGSIEWIAILFIGLYISITVTTLVMNKLAKRLNLIKTSIFGMFILLLSAIVIILSTNLYFVFIAFLLEGIGAGIWVPSKTAIYWQLAPKNQRESISGYLFGTRSFLNNLGPLVGGWLAVTFGILGPFYLKAGIAIFSILIYISILKTKTK